MNETEGWLKYILDEDVSEPEWEDHKKRTTWILGADINGKVFIIKAPNINESFFDNGYEPEYVGLPYDVPDWAGKIVEVKCSFSCWASSWEQPHIKDEWEFAIEEEKVLNDFY